MLWKLLSPKPVKQARRTVRRAVHPVRTAGWAVSPTPVKQARRAAFKVAHPVEAAEIAVTNQVVRSLRGQRRSAAPAPSRAPREGPSQSARQATRQTPPAPGTPPSPAVQVAWLPGKHNIPVAGLDFHRDAVRRTIAARPAAGSKSAILQPEPDNPHDPNAIGVWMSGGHVGYIPRAIAAVLQPALTAYTSSHDGLLAACPVRLGGSPSDPVLNLQLNVAKLGVDPASLKGT